MITLLSSLKTANKVGKVTILGDVDASVISVLPGHNENFRAWNGPTEDTNEYTMRAIDWGNKNRKEDGQDYITLVAWLLELGAFAREHHYDLKSTYRRYAVATNLCSCVFAQNPLALEMEKSVLLQMRKFVFLTGTLMSECLLDMGYGESAAAGLNEILNLLTIRPTSEILESKERSFATDLNDRIKNRYKSKDKGDGHQPEEPWCMYLPIP